MRIWSAALRRVPTRNAFSVNSEVAWTSLELLAIKPRAVALCKAVRHRKSSWEVVDSFSRACD